MHYTTTTPVVATLPPHTTLVVLIDPISTSCRIAQEISKRGHHIAALWTKSYAGETPERREVRSPARSGCVNLRYKVELQEGRDLVWNDDVNEKGDADSSE